MLEGEGGRGVRVSGILNTVGTISISKCEENEKPISIRGDCYNKDFIIKIATSNKDCQKIVVVCNCPVKCSLTPHCGVLHLGAILMRSGRVDEF